MPPNTVVAHCQLEFGLVCGEVGLRKVAHKGLHFARIGSPGRSYVVRAAHHSGLLHSVLPQRQKTLRGPDTNVTSTAGAFGGGSTNVGACARLFRTFATRFGLLLNTLTRFAVL